MRHGACGMSYRCRLRRRFCFMPAEPVSERGERFKNAAQRTLKAPSSPRIAFSQMPHTKEHLTYEMLFCVSSEYFG